MIETIEARLIEIIIILLGLLGILIKSHRNIRKIKTNDLNNLLTKNEFQEFQIKYGEQMTEVRSEIKHLKEDVSSLDVRLEKHLNQKRN